MKTKNLSYRQTIWSVPPESQWKRELYENRIAGIHLA